MNRFKNRHTNDMLLLTNMDGDDDLQIPSFLPTVEIHTTTSATINNSTRLTIESKNNIDRPEVEETTTTTTTTSRSVETEMESEEEFDNNASDNANAEMLIAIPGHIPPASFLVPPPFKPPVPVLIKRRRVPHQTRRYYVDDYNPKAVNSSRKRFRPVNSIQDILKQMESESMSQQLHPSSSKKPKRITFYGRYKHRPNRPKVIPIRDDVSASLTNFQPSVASEVNQLVVPTRKTQPPKQLFYPNYAASYSNNVQSGLYDQIVTTNKQRQEAGSQPKPFSLMLDIYPLNEGEQQAPVRTTQSTSSTTVPPPYPLYGDHSFYNTMKFPQINPYYQPNQIVYGKQTTHAPFLGEVHSTASPNDTPSKMVVHLNLYPTKKGHYQSTSSVSSTNHFYDPSLTFDDKEDEGFVPMVNPQIYLRSRSADDEVNQVVLRNLSVDDNVVEIPKRASYPPQMHHPVLLSSPEDIPALQTPYTNRRPEPNHYPVAKVEISKSIELGPPINVTDYATTIPPDDINRFIYSSRPSPYTIPEYFSNQVRRNSDLGDTPSTTHTPTTIAIKLRKSRINQHQRNSHQPDNPMIVGDYAEKRIDKIARDKAKRATFKTFMERRRNA